MDSAGKTSGRMRVRLGERERFISLKTTTALGSQSFMHFSMKLSPSGCHLALRVAAYPKQFRLRRRRRMIVTPPRIESHHDAGSGTGTAPTTNGESLSLVTLIV